MTFVRRLMSLDSSKVDPRWQVKTDLWQNSIKFLYVITAAISIFGLFLFKEIAPQVLNRYVDPWKESSGKVLEAKLDIKKASKRNHTKRTKHVVRFKASYDVDGKIVVGTYVYDAWHLDDAKNYLASKPAGSVERVFFDPTQPVSFDFNLYPSSLGFFGTLIMLLSLPLCITMLRFYRWYRIMQARKLRCHGTNV